MKVWGELFPSGSCEKHFSSPLLKLPVLQAILGVPWLAGASPQSLPRLHMAFSLCFWVSLSKFPPIRTPPVFGLGPILIPHDLT